MRSLLAYDAAGSVVATLDHMVARDNEGNVIGLIDFGAHEDAGGKLRDIWDVAGTTGSGTWPEWLGSAAHAFRVELTNRRITALVHRASGFRRERAAIEAAIAATPIDGQGMRDIRHIVGGPQRPILLDDDGRTIGPDHPKAPKGTPAHLPLIGR